MSIRRALLGGFQISLHGSKPGPRGHPLLAGPYPVRAGYLQMQGGVLTNAGLIELGASPVSARAVYVGLWSWNGDFEVASRLARPVSLVAGQRLMIRPGKLRVRIGE